jgi:hypothetical protein
MDRAIAASIRSMRGPIAADVDGLIAEPAAQRSACHGDRHRRRGLQHARVSGMAIGIRLKDERNRMHAWLRDHDPNVISLVVNLAASPRWTRDDVALRALARPPVRNIALTRRHADGVIRRGVFDVQTEMARHFRSAFPRLRVRRETAQPQVGADSRFQSDRKLIGG